MQFLLVLYLCHFAPEEAQRFKLLQIYCGDRAYNLLEAKFSMEPLRRVLGVHDNKGLQTPKRKRA